MRDPPPPRGGWSWGVWVGGWVSLGGWVCWLVFRQPQNDPPPLQWLGQRLSWTLCRNKYQLGVICEVALTTQPGSHAFPPSQGSTGPPRGRNTLSVRPQMVPRPRVLSTTTYCRTPLQVECLHGCRLHMTCKQVCWVTPRLHVALPWMVCKRYWELHGTTASVQCFPLRVFRLLAFP